MASRWYHAPVDPGYGQFGAAIAAGMGQAAGAYAAGQEREEELRRYEEQIARADRIRQDDIAREQARYEAQLALQGISTKPPPVTAMAGREIIRAVRPTSGMVAAPAAPPAGTMAVAPPVATPPPPPTTEEAMGVTAPVAAPVAPVTAPAPSATAAALEEPPVPAAALAKVAGVPAEQRGDGGWRELPNGMWYNPEQSLTNQQAAYQWERDRERAATMRKEVEDVIGGILADGKVSPQERATLVAMKIPEESIGDPVKMREAMEKWWKEQQKIQHDYEMLRIAARERSQSRALTANQQAAQVENDVLGNAFHYATAYGLDADDIFDQVRDRAQAVGGEGAIRLLIQKALDQKEQITYNQARNQAKVNLESRRIYPSNEKFAQLLDEETDKLREQARREAAERRRIWRDRRPPARDIVPGYGITTAGTVPTRTPTATSAAMTEPPVATTPVPAPAATVAPAPAAPAAPVAATPVVLDADDIAFLRKQRQRSPDMDVTRLKELLERDRARRRR